MVLPPQDGPALMKTFANDKPGWKLAALLLVRLPRILSALIVTAGASKAAGWW